MYPNMQTKTALADEQTLTRINFLYAKEYTPITDLDILWRNLRALGS